jgi:hypothetical protein
MWQLTYFGADCSYHTKAAWQCSNADVTDKLLQQSWTPVLDEDLCLMLRNFSMGIIFTIQLFCTVDNNAAHMNTCYSMWQNYEVHEKFKEEKSEVEWMNGTWVSSPSGPEDRSSEKKWNYFFATNYCSIVTMWFFCWKWFTFTYIKVSILNLKAHCSADNSVHQTVCILPNARSSDFKLNVHYTALIYQIVLTIQVSM